MVDFNKVRFLKDANIIPGDRWVYVADFNEEPVKEVKEGEKEEYARVDSEIKDISYILERGASVSILTSRGRFGDSQEDMDLCFLVPYLSRKLSEKLERRIEVKYFPGNVSDDAIRFAKSLEAKEIAIMGNTRQHEGEESEDKRKSRELAERFSKLGKYVAIGGFGKAHRKNASNYRILDFLPGFMTESMLEEMVSIGYWAGRQENILSVAVLGGVKKEKITIGLEGFIETYDEIIPGGIVLNTILKVRGFEIGDSVITEKEKSFEKEVGIILERNKKKFPPSIIHVPKRVIIARKTDTGYRDMVSISLEDQKRDRVPKGYRIVSFKLNRDTKVILDEVMNRRGRLVIAGTPDLYKEGFGWATNEIMERARRPEVRTLVLGGDTTREVDYKGKTSTGGGSSLCFLAYGTTPVFEKLKRNKEKFMRI